MQWANESPIEASFLYLKEKHNGTKVTGKATREPTLQGKRFDGNEPRLTIEEQPILPQPITRRVAADAGSKMRIVRRTGEVYLDALPHRSFHEAAFGVQLTKKPLMRQFSVALFDPNTLFPIFNC